MFGADAIKLVGIVNNFRLLLLEQGFHKFGGILTAGT
jgi:hypothetical protein